MKLTAADILNPEVLSPDMSSGEGHIKQFAQEMKAMIDRSKEIFSELEFYIPRVTNRKIMWEIIQLIQKSEDEIHNYSQRLKSVEEAWENEDFAEEDRRWEERKLRR